MASVLANPSLQSHPDAHCLHNLPANSACNSPPTVLASSVASPSDSQRGRAVLDKKTVKESPSSPSVDRLKILLHIPAAGKSKSADGKSDGEESKKKWNLRQKRVTFKIPNQEKLEINQLNYEADKKEKRKIMPNFSISLPKSEIEKDIMAITGSKLAKRPRNKRSMDVQRKLDSVFPGLGLPLITTKSYRVRDRRS